MGVFAVVIYPIMGDITNQSISHVIHSCVAPVQGKQYTLIQGNWKTCNKKTIESQLGNTDVVCIDSIRGDVNDINGTCLQACMLHPSNSYGRKLPRNHLAEMMLYTLGFDVDNCAGVDGIRGNVCFHSLTGSELPADVVNILVQGLESADTIITDSESEDDDSNAESEDECDEGERIAKEKLKARAKQEHQKHYNLIFPEPSFNDPIIKSMRKAMETAT